MYVSGRRSFLQKKKVSDTNFQNYMVRLCMIRTFLVQNMAFKISKSLKKQKKVRYFGLEHFEFI